MKFEFPIINHINDVLPAIEGRSEFIVAERDGYKVVNYVVSMTDTFPNIMLCENKHSGKLGPAFYPEDHHAIIRRECRGIIFDTDGNILARRLHKFFNINEREETQIDNVDFSRPHVILEKLDGSMITPIKIGDNIRWGTKMGLTDVAKPVEEFVKKTPKYEDFVRHIISLDKTAIFEWCSRSQRIVIDYPVDRLVLTAIRNNVTGEYDSIKGMYSLASY